MPFFIFLAILCFSSNAFAETTAYVSDDFEITLRSDKGPGKKILKMLATGTKLEVIETDEDEGYAYVRTGSGVEGWVLSRYLINQPVAKVLLERANSKVTELRKKLKEQDEQLNSLSKEKTSLERQSNSLDDRKSKLEKEIETIKRVSADQIALYEENQKLKGEVLTLRRDIQSIQQKNMNLQDESARNWFLVGAAVCVVGIFAGLVLPNMRFRKKSNWSSI